MASKQQESNPFLLLSMRFSPPLNHIPEEKQLIIGGKHRERGREIARELRQKESTISYL